MSFCGYFIRPLLSNDNSNETYISDLFVLLEMKNVFPVTFCCVRYLLLFSSSVNFLSGI